MPAQNLTYFMAIVMWLAIMAFAVLGGADFGAGVWDLVARGQTADQQRGALIRAIGPIWEANEIWLIFLVTGTWTAFPLVFSAVMTALFIPLSIALLGVVMRGAAFAFYSHFRAAIHVSSVWGRTFSAASTIAPFLFGAVAAAVVSGRIRVAPDGSVQANVITSWTTPFALACGCFAVALCACMAATYMTVEVSNQGEMRLVRIFRRRALVSGAIAALLGTVAAWLASFYAVHLFNGLTTRALPLALAAVVVGVLTAVALLVGLYRIARMLVAAEVALILGAWAIAQLPYLIVPDVPITRGTAPPGVMAALLIAAIVSMILVLPSTWYMLHLFKARFREYPSPTTDEYVERIAEHDRRLAAEAASAQQRSLHDGHDAHDGRRSHSALQMAIGMLPVVVTGAAWLWRSLEGRRNRGAAGRR
jgi:cytochrome d ubiquinol oxidase subunit II